MPKKDRARKNAARREKQRTGASYTSARAGTTHRHPVPDLAPLAELPLVLGRRLLLDQASALVGACRAGCGPCQESLTPVVAADHTTVAALAGAVYGLVPPGLLASASTRAWVTAVTSSFGGPVTDAPNAADELARLGADQVREVLEDALDHWAAGGAQPPTLLTVPLEESPSAPTYAVTLFTIALPGGPLPQLVLSPETPEAGLEDLRTRCGLPAWDMTVPPNVGVSWRVRVDIATRTLRTIVRIDDQGWDDVVLWEAAELVELPEQWWDLVDRTQHIVVCGPVEDLDELRRAAAADQTVGLVARVGFM